jgi:arylsulfatase A-like enzyme
LGEHNFFWQHGPLAFNSSARVPLIIYSPDKKSKRIKYPVSLMDIYPTVLDMLDLSLPYEIQGANLFKKPNKRLLKIKGTDGTGISGSFSVIFNNHHHVRVSKKLSKKLDLETKFLYDIYQDPYEINTLYSEKKKLSQYMENEYIQFFDKHRKKEKEEKVELSPEEIEKLKALGYIK